MFSIFVLKNYTVNVDLRLKDENRNLYTLDIWTTIGHLNVDQYKTVIKNLELELIIPSYRVIYDADAMLFYITDHFDQALKDKLTIVFKYNDNDTVILFKESDVAGITLRLKWILSWPQLDVYRF